MTTTTKLALELLQNSAANQILANLTFARINQLIQAGAVDKDLGNPPGSPADEALYIVGSPATGAWSGHAGNLAFWLAATSQWTFITPKEGFLVHVNDEDVFYKYTGSAWVVFSSGGGMTNPMTTLGDIIIGGASGAPTRLALGANGLFLGISAGAIAWLAAMTNPMTTAGDLIVGGASGAPTRLAKGSDGQALIMSAGNVAWINAALGGTAGVPFMGAMVNLTSNTTLAAPPAQVTWAAAAYDTASFWSAGSPTRLTVPAGVTRVRLFTTLAFDTGTFATVANTSLSFRKNGNDFIGNGFGAMASGYPNSVFTTISAVIPVVAGDYFEVRWNTSRAGTSTILSASCAFAIEAIPEGGLPVINDATVSRTLSLTDATKWLRMTNALATSVTVPPESSVNFPIGTEVTVQQAGAGLVTLVAGSGVTINRKSPKTLAFDGQYSVVRLKKTFSNTWIAWGDLA